MSDYWLVRRCHLDIDSLYTRGERSQYWYKVRVLPGQGRGRKGSNRWRKIRRRRSLGANLVCSRWCKAGSQLCIKAQ